MKLLSSTADSCRFSPCSKFFSRPDGSKPTPTQQTKLSFTTKSTDKSKKPTAEKKKDVEDEAVDKEVKPSGQESPSGASIKENAVPVPGKTTH